MGVEDVASDAGFSVIFCNTDESEIEQDEHLTVLMKKRVDGILLVPAESTAASMAFVRQRTAPVVVLDRRVPAVAWIRFAATPSKAPTSDPSPT